MGYLSVVVEVEGVEHAFGELLGAVQAQNAHVFFEGLAADDPIANRYF